MIFQVVKEFLDIIEKYKVDRFRTFDDLYEIVLEIHVIDKSTHFVRDYLFSSNVRKYSFHWQDVKGVCIVRWDNVPHHQEITTFPFHKHIGKNEDVVDSEAMNLKKVLEIIKNRII